MDGKSAVHFSVSGYTDERSGRVPMRGKQRLLKFAILLWMPVLVIAAAGAYAGTFWYFYRGTTILATSDSSDGDYRAIILYERDGHECGEMGDTFVVLQRRRGVLKTAESAPFCADSTAADGLSIRWSGEAQLTISCPHCSDGKFDLSSGGQRTISLRLER